MADLIRQAGISEQTFYRWKKEYAGLEPQQARGLKQRLADDNARLKEAGSVPNFAQLTVFIHDARLGTRPSL